MVDTKTATIISGANTFATIKADTKLLDFFVDIALNNSYKDIIANAQWDFVLGANASLIKHVKTNSWGKDAVQLLVHLNYWLPGYAWMGHQADNIATAGDCTKIILTFKKNQLQFGGELVKHLKAFAGNAFAKYIALPKYQTPLAANTCAIFEDGANKYYVPL